MDAVPGKANDALNQVQPRLRRGKKHNNVPVPYLPVRHKRPQPTGGGANCTRFTNRWSPTSRVFSIEEEGIANACIVKVIMNNPVTRITAREARNSTGVSRAGSSFFSISFLLTLLFLAT